MLALILSIDYHSHVGMEATSSTVSSGIIPVANPCQSFGLLTCGEVRHPLVLWVLVSDYLIEWKYPIEG